MSNRGDQKLLGNLSKGIVFVLSAPAGTGKTTLVNLLCDEFSCITRSISYTTRKQRPGEVAGVDYHFLSRQEFQKRLQEGDFIEHAQVFDDFYGTSQSCIERKLKTGQHVILVIDTQGAQQIREKIPAVFIFMSPPSMDELSRRLHSRATDSKEAIAKRLKWAENELLAAKNYDYHILNANLSVAYETLRSILIAEEHRVVLHNIK